MNKSAVIFDLDGTLTKPYLNFDLIRTELGVEGPILEAMKQMDASSRDHAEVVLLRHEHEAAHHVELYDGAVEIVKACRTRGHPVGILTRNARPTVDVVLARFGIEVDALRTREDGAIKPSGEPLCSICHEVGADPARSWMVGDYLFDLLSGQAAGTRTVLMVGDGPRPDFADQADHVIQRLAELLPLIESG